MDRSNLPEKRPWQDCPPQTISGLVRQQQQFTRRQAITSWISGGLTVAATAVCGVVIYRSTQPATRELTRVSPARTGVCCSTVMSCVDGYLAGTLNSCLQRGIDRHLAVCQPCAQVIETLREDGATAEREDV